MIAAIGITTFTRMNFFPERATISTEIGEVLLKFIAYPPRKDKALSVAADWAFALLAVPHGTVMAEKTANSEAAPRWREASDTLPLNRESDHTGTSEYRIAKFSVIGAE